MTRFRLKHVPMMLTLAYMAIVIALCRPDAADFARLLRDYAISLGSTWIMIALILLLFTTIRRHRADPSTSAIAIARGFVERRWSHDRCFSMLSPLLTLICLLASYNLYKQVFLPTVGFWFGPHAAAVDRLLFGTDPWRLTHGILRTPWATQIVDLAYHAWFLPMVLGVALCSFGKVNSTLGLRYLLGYVLLWIVQGSIVACLIPAAGPCFYHSFQPDPTHFDALTRLLRDQDAFLRANGGYGLSSMEFQQGLLTLFHAPELAIGGGISAMPSLHNAMAVLFACACWSFSRTLGVAAILYALVIWIGSVHLGWHYAFDGIVACALTLATWTAAGRVMAMRWVAATPLRVTESMATA